MFSASRACSPSTRRERFSSAARDAGLGLKLHADELRPSGGAELAGGVRRDVRRPSRAPSPTPESPRSRRRIPSPRCCPERMLFLGKDRQAPARALIDAGAAVALATDFNPGTSPTPNFPLILTLGVSQLRMSVAEALLAATVNGAAALGLADRDRPDCPGFSRRPRALRHRGCARAAVLVRRPALSSRPGSRRTLVALARHATRISCRSPHRASIVGL